MKIEITLLSDLCTGSGETYNSLVDTDVVYDEDGLPYIPAKRLKGCIREAALEMKELDLITPDVYNDLFGKEGHKSSRFTISNAYLKNYEGIKKSLDSWKSKDLVSQQEVLSLYTSMRTQTAVDLNTGVADDTSLRTIRVVNKHALDKQNHLVFEAECDIKKEEYKKVLADAISLVKHIGVARTRGLGLVKLKLDAKSVDKPKHIKMTKDDIHEGINKLRYTIKLHSAMICKSAQGNQAESQDYIAGSKVLGVIAEALRDTNFDFREFMNKGELIVTNAYITHKGNRTIIAPSSLQKKKDQAWDNNTMKIVDMRHKPNVTDVQLTPAGIPYMGSDGSKVDVSTEISYHHQRPSDKTIGRATGDERDGSSFYQLCSISAGQSFGGYIYANKEQAEQIIETVEKLGEIRMGYGKSSEYGAVDFVIDRVEILKSEAKFTRKAAITLQSDMILYNENGFLSTDMKDLEKYLNNALGTKDVKIINPFLSFTTIGGYNVTWRTRKPIFKAFAKGTSFLIESNEEFDINMLNNTFIGERVSEGFGEVQAQDISQLPNISEKTYEELMKSEGSQQIGDPVIKIKNPKDNVSTDVVEEDKTGIIHALLQREYDRRLEKRIIDDLETKKDSYKNHSKDFGPAVARLRLIFKNVETYKEMENQIEGIESDAKKRLCRDLLVEPKGLAEQILTNLNMAYNLSDTNAFSLKKNDDEIFKYVYSIYIAELNNLAKIIK